MSGHTEGPWGVWAQPDGDRLMVTDNRYARHIAYMAGQDEEANASLVAAAPTMYDALKPLADTKIRVETLNELHSRIIEVSGNGPFADWIYELLSTHADAARAALKQAEETT